MGTPTKLRNIDKQLVIDKYLETRSLKATADFFHVTDMAINYYLKKYKIEKCVYDPHKYKCNGCAFSEITEESAYWIGFLAADGSLFKDRPNKITLTLAKKDRDHIVKFKIFLGAENPVLDYERNHSKTSMVKGSSSISSLAIDNDQIASDLRKLGFTHTKTYNFNPPVDQIPEKYHKDFWRGMIDGDGWVCYNPARGYESIILGLCGTKELCEEFFKFLKSQGCTANPRPREKSHSPGHYSVELGGHKNTTLMLEKLYADASVYLDRKYNKAIEVINAKPLPWGSTTGKRT